MPSLDHSVYNSPESGKPSSKDGIIRIAAMVRPQTPRRSPGLTMDVLAALKGHFGGAVEINIFGVRPDDQEFLALNRDFEFNHHGLLVRAEVASVLRRSDLFLDLSEYQAFGRTGLEAMACGCATILPHVGGCDEYAEDGENALLINELSVDSILAMCVELCEDSEQLAKLKKAAIETAQRYSVERASRSILGLFLRHMAARNPD